MAIIKINKSSNKPAKINKTDSLARLKKEIVIFLLVDIYIELISVSINLDLMSFLGVVVEMILPWMS